jgi:branched-chain amino acid transport system substrate-binding protein
VVNRAGIPLVVNLAASEALLHTPGVFVLRNPLAFFGTAAAVAREDHLASTTLVTPDVPAAVDPARTLGPPLFANAGSAASVLPIGLGVRDMSPQIAEAERSRPDMYLVQGDATFCTSAIGAIRRVGSTARIMSVDQCIGRDRGAAIPGGLTGVDVITQAVIDPGSPESALFAAVRTTYGQGIGASAETASAYHAMLGVVRAVNANRPAEVTAATVSASISHALPARWRGDLPLRRAGRAADLRQHLRVGRRRSHGG